MSRTLGFSAGQTLLVVLSTFATGCIPAVNHGPQIESGWSGGLTASYPVGPRYSTADDGAWPYLLGPLGVNVARGWRGSGDGGAFQLGVHAPATLALSPPEFFEFAQADAYYQLPARISGTLDAGLGINLSSYYVMPYVQAGRIGADGSGWYTTQGVSVMWDYDEIRPDGVGAVFWMPTVAYQIGRPRHTIHWFVTGGVGSVRGGCFYFEEECGPNEPRYVLSAGVSLQFHQKK